MQSRQASPFKEDFEVGPERPILGEWRLAAAGFDETYFLQDLYVARKIFNALPTRHIDVGSSFTGLVANVATFTDVTFLDVRPPPIDAPHIQCVTADITKLGDLQLEPAESHSCLHVIEHIGLGRYGDRVDFDGWHVAISALAQILSPSGTLYLSVPISHTQRVEFNAHRVFRIPFLVDRLQELFDIADFAYISDSGELRTQVDLSSPAAQASFSSNYACGIFTLRRGLHL